MTVSPVASAEKIQTALTNLGTPNGFIAYDIVPLLQQLVVALGNVSTGGGSSAITGEIKIWPTNTAPSGYLLCQGDTVLIADYPDLYAVIGITYGAGGAGTFRLPDFRDTVPAGVGTTFSSIGANYGSMSQTLTSFNLPSLSTTDSATSSGGDFNSLTSVSYSGSGSTPVDVTQPSLAINFIIKT